MRKSNKKGQMLQGLGGVAIGIASFTIIIAVIFLVIAQTKEQVESIDGVNSSGGDGAGAQTSASWNATSELQGATADIPGWVPLIVIVIIGGLILGMVKAFGGQ